MSGAMPKTSQPAVARVLQRKLLLRFLFAFAVVAGCCWAVLRITSRTRGVGERGVADVAWRGEDDDVIKVGEEVKRKLADDDEGEEGVDGPAGSIRSQQSDEVEGGGGGGGGGDSEKELRLVLSAAATSDRTVLVTVVTTPWKEMMTFFVERLKMGNGTLPLLRHFVFVCWDQEIMDLCLEMKLSCFLDTEDGKPFLEEQKDKPVDYMTPHYLRIVWKKIELNRRILSLGFNVFFSDIDAAWLQNPFPHLRGDADIFMSSDFYLEDPANATANTGVAFFRNSRATKQFLDRWLASRLLHGESNDQQVFHLVRPEVDQFTAAAIGVRIAYLPTATFAGACELPHHVDALVIFHANCCEGLRRKLFLLREVTGDRDWWLSLSEEMKSGIEQHGFSWSPIVCEGTGDLED